MIPYTTKIIENNLVRYSTDAELSKTLLPDEKCVVCGTELSKESKQRSRLCGKCTRTIGKNKYCISDITWRINNAHGTSFYNAFDIYFESVRSKTMTNMKRSQYE